MDVASTGTGPPDCVWVKIYYKGQEEAIGDAIKIKPIPDDVADLRDTIREKCPNVLHGIDANMLAVYPTDTSLPVSNASEPLKSGGSVPLHTTDEEPLIVIAPKPQAQRQQQDGKLRCFVWQRYSQRLLNLI
jgi:hypothetical protein